MSSDCFANLLATSREHRSQIHNAVTGISISDSTHANAVVSRHWPHLKTWTSTHKNLSGQTTIHLSCDMTAAAASVLAKANMLQPWHLHLTCDHLPASVIGELVKQNWPTLQCLNLGHVKLTAAAMQELAAGKWPSLKCLLSHGMAEDTDTLSVFASAETPQLEMLHLLHTKDIQDLEEMARLGEAFSLLMAIGSIPEFDETGGAASLEVTSSLWSQLEYLALENQSIDASAMSKLMLAGLTQLATLQLNGMPLDAAAVLELSHGHLPKLQTLMLIINLSSAAVPSLSQGRWPLLTGLYLMGNPLEDAILEDLSTGQWPLLHTVWLTLGSLHGCALSLDEVQRGVQPARTL